MLKEYRADLHIHTVLSPCGDLEMSPVNILASARKNQIHILGITDHNHTGNAWLLNEMAEADHILVIPGAEVTTREEVHCLTYFRTKDSLDLFQQFLDEKLIRIQNHPEKLGYQVLVDREENVVAEVEYYLGSSIDASVEEVEEMVHALGGIFVPAHIDRKKNSIYSQLGFVPSGLVCDALEISWRTHPDDFLPLHPEISGQRLTRSSDAHFLADIGRVTSVFVLENLTLDEVWMAFQDENHRKILPA
jgi:PHP family Zn ribbon phosphoesterase